MKEEKRQDSDLNLDKLIDIISGNGQNILYNGVTEGELTIVEKELGVKLPGSFRKFLEYTDGAFLYQTEEIFGISVGISEGLSSPRSLIVMKNALKDVIPNYLIPFYQANGQLYFDVREQYLDEYPVVQVIRETQEIVKVAESFTHWLESEVREFQHF